MEDVLEVYKQPYDPLRPVVCLDETSRQLIEEITPEQPAIPGKIATYDYEYVRNGIVDIFMMYEPLAGKRYLSIKDTRTRVDFAHCLYELSEKYYVHVEKIVLVMDNLNTHSLASSYETYNPDLARRLAERFEIHYTPKHASWLDMAEIEIGVMSRQCLKRRIATKSEMSKELNAWMCQRNQAATKTDWQFTTSDARIKLKSLYPKIKSF